MTEPQDKTAEKSPTQEKLPYFAPNKGGDDMDAVFDGTARFYDRARDFIQEDKVDAIYELLDALKEKITNKAALLLIIIGQKSQKRKNNLRRSLKMSSFAELNDYIEDQLSQVAGLVDVTEGSQHHRFFAYACEFMGVDKASILANVTKIDKANPMQAAKPVVEEPKNELKAEPQLETDVQKILAAVLITLESQQMNATISKESKNLINEQILVSDRLLKMGAEVLDARSFSCFAFYARPKIFYAANDKTKRVSLPSSAEQNRRSAGSVEACREIAYRAMATLRMGDYYKTHSNFSTAKLDRIGYLACTELREIMKELSEKVSPNVVSEVLQVLKKQKPEEKKINPVQEMLKAVLGTIPEKNKIYRSAQSFAASVLTEEDYAVLAHYLRPTHMRRSSNEHPLPKSVIELNKGKSVEELRVIGLQALRTVISSPAYIKSRKSDDAQQKGMHRLFDGLKNFLEAKEEAKKPAKKQAKPPETTPKQRGVVGIKKGETTAVAPAAPVATASFNSSAMAAVVAEEQKHITPYSIKGALLGFFAEVAGVSPVAVKILSQTMLRKEPIKPADAAKPLADMGLSFDDAVNVVNGAVEKIREKAKGNADYQFVIDALKGYKFT